jgi:protein required for attachment to host cells
MTKRNLTWFVLADGSRARFLTKRPEISGYDVVAEYESAEAHIPSHELGADHPGRTHESMGASRHAIAPRQDMHKARKTAFARDVAAHLNDANRQGLFDFLVVFAAPHTLGELRVALDAETQKRIKGEVAKDLTKLPLVELPLHLAEFA